MVLALDSTDSHISRSLWMPSAARSDQCSSLYQLFDLCSAHSARLPKSHGRLVRKHACHPCHQDRREHTSASSSDTVRLRCCRVNLADPFASFFSAILQQPVAKVYTPEGTEVQPAPEKSFIQKCKSCWIINERRNSPSELDWWYAAPLVLMLIVGGGGPEEAAPAKGGK